MTKKIISELSYEIIGSAIEVHRELGPGLLENVYEKCLIYVLKERGLDVCSQVKVPVLFKGKNLDLDLRLDLLVNNAIIVELKSIQGILPIHEAQLLTYLKLTQKPKGFLFNFNCSNLMKEGQRNFVTDYYAILPN